LLWNQPVLLGLVVLVLLLIVAPFGAGFFAWVSGRRRADVVRPQTTTFVGIQLDLALLILGLMLLLAVVAWIWKALAR
jgi:hypothetical protein